MFKCKAFLFLFLFWSLILIQSEFHLPVPVAESHQCTWYGREVVEWSFGKFNYDTASPPPYQIVFGKIQPLQLIITPCLLSNFTIYAFQKKRLLKQSYLPNVNESRSIALFLVRGSIKKLFSIDFVDSYSQLILSIFKAFPNWLCQYLFFLEIFFHRFWPVEKCKITPTLLIS